MYFYILILIISYLLFYYFTRTFNYWKNKNIDGPKPVPFFGNFKEVVMRKKPKVIFYNEIYKQYPEEKVVGIYLMTSPVLLIRDLDIVKQVMIKDFESFPDRGTNFSKVGLGENIFHSDAETWKLLRHRFTSVFTSSKLKSIFPLLVENGDKLINYVDNLTMEKPEQDVYDIVMKYTVATALAIGFGWDIDTFNNDFTWSKDFDANQNTSHLQEMDMIFPGILTKLNLSVLHEKTRNMCHQILKQACDENENSDKISNVKDVMLNMRKQSNSEKERNTKITDSLLAGQVWVYYTAGYLNNLLSLTYALYHLARNPDVQAKLRKEINDVMEKHDNKLTYDVLKEMKYVEMVFEETVRLQPTTHGITRAAREDVKIDGTDLTINKGTLVVIPVYAIHRDEKNFPEPEVFKPERFSPENSKGRHPCAFASFGAGPRKCIGTLYARIQFGVCIVKLLSRFQVEISNNTCSTIQYDPHHFIIKPKERILLNIIPTPKSN